MGDGDGGSDPSDDIRAVERTYQSYDKRGRERLWDRSNPGFDRLKTDIERSVVGLLEQSLRQDKHVPAVLDVGCGDGDLPVLSDAANLGVSWTGIDVLPDRIRRARSRAPHFTFVVGSAHSMPFGTHSFDAATAVTLFSSIPSEEMQTLAAREIGRVLRPGGWLIWYDLRYDNPSNRGVHGVGHRRLAELFPGWRQEIRSLTLAPPIARRLGPLTPVAYPLLHAIPLLRSHLVGRLQCPP